jgi:DNA-binding NtrC family response regulator
MTRKRTAFVVDDDAAYAERVMHHMQKLNFEVKHFSSGTSFLKQLPTAPDLIILDYDLGEKTTGLEYLQKIKNITREIPVLLLLAQNDISTAVQALKFGAYDYIEKNNTSFFARLRTSLYDLDIEKKRKFWTVLKAFRKGIFNLYNIYPV